MGEGLWRGQAGGGERRLGEQELWSKHKHVYNCPRKISENNKLGHNFMLDSHSSARNTISKGYLAKQDTTRVRKPLSSLDGCSQLSFLFPRDAVCSASAGAKQVHALLQKLLKASVNHTTFCAALKGPQESGRIIDFLLSNSSASAAQCQILTGNVLTKESANFNLQTSSPCD